MFEKRKLDKLIQWNLYKANTQLWSFSAGRFSWHNNRKNKQTFVERHASEGECFSSFID